eukprot:TRINITY_DN24135_c0_g1_i1.p1 TRINITY_DN24135_c0_g1~~TRINITY_DN24135_c0_g1_i1.p1  ORF type:complete len:663 (-),score=228.86 TRINITY_DN24135_c0_g1_i1:130-2118(-)
MGYSGDPGGAAVNFPEPPLKRVYPWSRDNRYGTDILAGKIKPNGAFDGVVLKDVQLQTLEKYLEMAESQLLPDTLSKESRAVGEALQDGFPTIVLTRGVYGRELDPANGPVRNSAQETIWRTVRQARERNTRMDITCIDVPADLPSAEIGRCLQPPLSNYKELAYYGGVWYTPKAVSAEKTYKFSMEHPQTTIWQSKLQLDAAKNGKSKVIFKPKPFTWKSDGTEKNLYALAWVPVLADEKSVTPTVDADRLASGLVFDETEPRDTDSSAPAMDLRSLQQLLRQRRMQLQATGTLSGEEIVAALTEAAGEMIARSGQLREMSEAEVQETTTQALKYLEEIAEAPEEKAAAGLALAQAAAASGDVGAAKKALESSCLQLRKDLKKGSAAAEAAAIASVAARLQAAGKREAAAQLVAEALEGCASKGEAAACGDLLDSAVKGHLAAGQPAQAFEAAATVAKCLEGQGKSAVFEECRALFEVGRLQLIPGAKQEAEDIDSVANRMWVLADKAANSGEMLKVWQLQLELVALRLRHLQAAGSAVDGNHVKVLLQRAQAALQLCSEDGDLAGQALVHSIISTAQLALKDAAAAQQAACKAEELCEQADVADRCRASVCLASARAMSASGQKQLAMQRAKQALVHASAAADQVLKQQALQAISAIKAN